MWFNMIMPKINPKNGAQFPSKEQCFVLYKQPVQGYQRRIARWDNYNKKNSDERPVGMSLLKVNFDDPSIWQASWYMPTACFLSNGKDKHNIVGTLDHIASIHTSSKGALDIFQCLSLNMFDCVFITMRFFIVKILLEQELSIGSKHVWTSQLLQ